MDCDVGPREAGVAQADLPSILPCSQSTMTQSGPERARILEILAPANICQRPIAGRLASSKTCFSRLDRNMLAPVSVVDIARGC
jgi:hypothetical protein